MSKKINKLRIIKYGQISDIEIIPSSNTVTLTGDNGQGKTTILRAIENLVFGGTLEEPVVKAGEKRSDIIAEIDKYIIKWRKTVKSPPQVEIRLKDTNEKIGTTRAVLSEILGSKLLADPLALVNEKDQKKQRKMFMDLLELDTEMLDNKEKYRREKRADIHRELKRLDGHIKTLTYTPDVKKVNILELTDQLNAANMVNNDIINKESELARKKDKYKSIQAEIDNLKSKIADLENEAAQVKSSGVEISNFLKETKPVDTSILEDHISKAEVINEQVRNNVEYDNTVKEREEQERLYEAETDKIKEICSERDKLLESKNLTELGLTITPECILFNDLPLKKASTGQKIKLGIDFLVTLDPEFKVLWIEDGDKLDNNNYNLIKEIAKEKDIQIWIEAVSRIYNDNAIVLEGGKIIKGGDTGEAIEDASEKKK